MSNFYDKYNEYNAKKWNHNLYGDNFYNIQKDKNESVNTNKPVMPNVPYVYKDDEIRNLKTELAATKEDLADANSELKYIKKKLYEYKFKADSFDKLFELFKDKFNRDINYRDVTDHRGTVLARYKKSETYSLTPLTSGEVFEIIKIFFDAFGYDESEFEKYWETTSVETDNDDTIYSNFYHKKKNKYK